MDPATREVLDRLIEEIYDRREDAREMFERMDTNGSGTLSRPEMMRAMRSMNVRLSPSELTMVMESFDVNGDGQVRWQDLYRAVEDREDRTGGRMGSSSCSARSSFFASRCT